MNDRFLLILGAAGLLLMTFAAWVAGIAFVSADSARRGLPGWLRVLWLLLALLPLIGLTAYVLAYSRPGPAPARAASRPYPRRRVTLARAPEAWRAPALRHDTIPTVPVTAVPRAAATPPPGTYALAVLEGPHSGQEFAVREFPARIGRGPEAAIRLDGDLGVSRRHAELYQQAGVLRLRDLGSAHGTSINGYNVTDKGLQAGDRIRVGHSLLLVKGANGSR